MDLSESSFALQNDIRKLKLELMRQELNDKLLTLNFYLEQQRQLNTTTASTTTVDPSESRLELKPFGSALFVKVVGDFVVWHFVLLALFVWVFIIIIIKYACKLVNVQRAKRRHRSSMKLKKELQNTLRAKNKQLAAHLTLEKDRVKEKQTTVVEVQNQEVNAGLDLNPFQNKPIEYFLPPKRDFFLYTIHEHEKHAKKVFTFKRNNQLHSSSKTNLLSLNKTLSKSDSNLFKLKNTLK